MTFNKELKEALQIARELKYSEKCIKKLKECKTIEEIYRILHDAREGRI